MQWIERWRPISERISGFIGAVNFFVRIPDSQGLFQNVVGNEFMPEVKAIDGEISALEREFQDLPAEAIAAIATYRDADVRGSMKTGKVHGVAHLMLLQTRLNYAAKDEEATARSLTELAFEHLRRSIVVNEGVGSAWRDAFDAGETECERLGAVHLLGHGVWAFKVSSAGAATDLVFAEPTTEKLATAERVARSIVLTEWKKVRNGHDLDAKAREAREQTRSYSAGVLGGLELKRTRYVVLVTSGDERPPDDVQDADVRYRHIVVPAKPLSPSQNARRASKKGRRK